jgi:tetratricopeptide (TPR) repeat protein
VIGLRGIGKRACERLVQQVLGKHVATQSVEWMVEQSGGNALLLEELIRAAAEGQFDKKPDTVIAMLQARIGHLSASARRVLVAAAVFGQTLWNGGVARILDLPEDAPELQESLRGLMAQELIEAQIGSRIPGQKEYVFRHALVCDAAYALLTDADRKIGPRRAAEFIAERGNPNQMQGLVGHHYRQAGSLDKAVEHFTSAGDQAAKRFLYSEARRHYVAVAEILELLPHSPAMLRSQVDVLTKQVQCSLFAESPTANFQRLARGQGLLQSLQKSGNSVPEDRLRRARLDYLCGRQHIIAGQPSLAVPCFQRALPIGSEFQEQELVLVPSTFLGLALYNQGHVTKAIALLEPVVTAMERVFGKDLETMRAHGYLATSLALAGHHARSSGLLAHIQPWLEEIQQPVYSGSYYAVSASAWLFVGDWPAVIEDSKHAIRHGEELHEPILQYVGWDLTAAAQSAMGDHDSALKSRARALALRNGVTGGSIAKEDFEAVHSEIFLRVGRL